MYAVGNFLPRLIVISPVPHARIISNAPMSFPDANNLLRTKLLPPRPHTPVIRRDALLTRLDSALACKLTICTAPAGFGKTTLVSQWLAQLRIENEELRIISRQPRLLTQILRLAICELVYA